MSSKCINATCYKTVHALQFAAPSDNKTGKLSAGTFTNKPHNWGLKWRDPIGCTWKQCSVVSFTSAGANRLETVASFFLLLWVAATLCIVTFLSARQPGTHKKKHVAPSAWVSQHKTTSAFSAPNPEFILLLTSNQGIPYLEARSASRKILRYSLKPFLCLWLDNLHPQFEHDVKQLIERYLFFVLFHWVYISINVVNICLYIWYETRNRRRHG